MSALTLDAGLGLCWSGGPARQLARRRLPDHGISAPVDPAVLWDAAFFGLDRVDAFRSAPATAQREILGACARGKLLEAYFIEKAGVSYAAKMTLLAETADERTLYALFCAEEAAHLDAIRAALGPVDESGWQADPFLGLLQTIVEEADRQTGQLVIQVALEGWGLLHYGALRDRCRHGGLRQTLAGIVADEAGHHGSGVALLRGEALAPAAARHAAALLGEMLAMIQVGPALVAEALERTLGGLTPGQRRRVFAQLGAERHVRDRLGRLRGCLDKVPAAAPVTAALERAGRFTVPSLEALA